jgi:short-subunit dehydrogenase
MIDGLTSAVKKFSRGPKLPNVCGSGGRALVTGASSGIGWACAEALVKAGFEVIGTSRRGAEAPHPEGVEMVALDMSSADDISAVVARGPYDVVVANAGESQSGAFEELPREALERLFQVNVLGQVELLQQLLPGMRAAGRGRIVLIGSMLGGLPLSYRSSYVATKAAIRGFGLAMRGEVAQFGIGVTVVEPGAINTGISARRTTYSDDGSVYATDLNRMLTRLNANEEGGIPASKIAELVMREVAAERPLPLVARGSSASVAVPFMRRIPTQAMLTIMRRVHGLR